MANLDPRQQRGLAIVQAKGNSIREVLEGKYLVPSQSRNTGSYFVDPSLGVCSCPDHEDHGQRCKHIYAVLYLRRELEMPVGDPIAASSPDAIGCAAAIRAMSCDEFRTTSGRPPACRFTGNDPNGKACGTDWQCKSGFCSFTSSCGVCADAPKAGDACAGFRCGPGLVCAERCVVPGKAGATCKTSSDCEQTLSCASGVCAARVGAGAACGSGKPDCVPGYYCGSANVCTVLKLAALGESCGVVGTDYLFCKGSYCKSAGRGVLVGNLRGVHGRRASVLGEFVGMSGAGDLRRGRLQAA